MSGLLVILELEQKPERLCGLSYGEGEQLQVYHLSFSAPVFVEPIQFQIDKRLVPNCPLIPRINNPTRFDGGALLPMEFLFT